ERTDDGQALRLFSQPLVTRGELNAFNRGVDRSRVSADRLARLWIECFQLTRPAGQPQQDQGLRRLATGRLLGPLGQQMRHWSQPRCSAQRGQLQHSPAAYPRLAATADWRYGPHSALGVS